MTALIANSDVDCRELLRTDDYLFFEKSSGVHSIALNETETNSCANWLLAVDPQQSALHPLEAGLAHRLDRDTSGIMVAARNQKALDHLKNLFRERQITKEYICIATNTPPQKGLHEAFAGPHPKSAKKVVVHGKPGRGLQKITTEILSATKHKLGTKLSIKLITGYRHQIRAHLAFLDCPILGDTLYKGAVAARLHLHAEKLSFVDADGKRIQSSSPCPFA